MGLWINRLGNQLRTAQDQWTIAKLMVTDRAQEQNLKKVTFGDIVQQYRKIKQMVASGSEEWKTICNKLDRYRKNGVLQAVKGKLKFHKERFVEIHKQIETYRSTLKDVQATADLKWKDLMVYRQCLESLENKLKALEVTKKYAEKKGISEEDRQFIGQKCAALASKIDRHKKLCKDIASNYLEVKGRVDLQVMEMNKEDFVPDDSAVRVLHLLNLAITELLNENVLDDLHDLQVAFISHFNKPQAILAQHQENINKSLEGIQKDCMGCQAEGEFLSRAQKYLEDRGAGLEDHFGDYILKYSIQDGNRKNDNPAEYTNIGEALDAWIGACASGIQEASELCDALTNQYKTLSSAYEAFQNAVAQMTEALARGTGNFEKYEKQLNDALGQLKGLVNANSSDSVADDPQEIVERFSAMLQKQREAASKARWNISKHVQAAIHTDVYSFLGEAYNKYDKKG